MLGKSHKSSLSASVCWLLHTFADRTFSVWGTGGREFKSRRSDQQLQKASATPRPTRPIACASSANPCHGLPRSTHGDRRIGSVLELWQICYRHIGGACTSNLEAVRTARLDFNGLLRPIQCIRIRTLTPYRTGMGLARWFRRADGNCFRGPARRDRKSTRLNSSHSAKSRMPSSA